jgi:hypothetical protein
MMDSLPPFSEKVPKPEKNPDPQEKKHGVKHYLRKTLLPLSLLGIAGTLSAQSQENNAGIDMFPDEIVSPVQKPDSFDQRFLRDYGTPEENEKKLSKLFALKRNLAHRLELPTTPLERETLEEALRGVRIEARRALDKVVGRSTDSVEFRKSYRLYDAYRDDLQALLQNPIYQARFSQELAQSGLLGAETYVAEKEQENIDRDYHVVAGTETDPFDAVEASYSPEGGVELPASPEDATVAYHEFWHEVKDVDRFITPFAKKPYEESMMRFSLEYYQGMIDSSGGKLSHKKPEELKLYYETIAELDTRRRAFEFEARRLGIWRYGDTFTENDLEKVFQKETFEKLSDDAQDFLKYTKREKIADLINRLA